MSSTGFSERAELPAGWEWATLEQVAEVSGGIQKSPKRRPNQNHYPFLRVANVARGSLDLSDVHRVELFEGELERLSLRLGDLLVVEGNGSPDQIGRAAAWRDTIADCVHQNHLIRVRPMAGLSWRYLELAWNSPVVSDQLLSVAQSSSGLYTLSTGKLKRVLLPVPPLVEQQRIVDVLEAHVSRLDAADELLRKSILRVMRLKHSVADITFGFHVSDFSEAAPLPSASGTVDGSLPMLPKEWSWRRLGEIADVAGGVTKDSKKQQDLSHPEVPYLRVANVQRGRLDLECVTRIRVPQKKLDQLRLLPGDVLMNEGGDRDKLGRGWVWEGAMDEVIHQNHVFRARIKNEVLLPKLLSCWANSMGHWFEKNGKQSTNLASIGLKKIKDLPVPVPPAEVQLDILKRIEEQSLIAAKAEEVLHLAQRRSRLLRKALLRKAFSGRLIPQNRDDEPAAALLERIRVERAAQPRPKRTRARKAPAARKAAATAPAPEATEPPRASTQQELAL
ncbi:restriction endonuclease subunit S [Streptomyces ardesiacus]|uniref:restriction endonuclease subunit S n=1 Tax=Streptomyces ardesiacus TaxID=285564 RepID=UPI00367F76F9